MTTKASHTPGPWTIKDYKDDHPTAFIKHGKDCIVEVKHLGMNRLDEYIANARLIAAAPTMREALEAIINRHEKTFPGITYEESWNFAYKQAKAALALADGKEQP